MNPSLLTIHGGLGLVPSPTRMRLGAYSLVAAAPVLFAADLVRSDHSGKAARQFAEVAARRTPELLSAGLFLIGAVLLGLAAFGLAGTVGGRGGRLASIGVAVSGIGALWIGIGRAMYSFLLYAATNTDLDHRGASTVFEGITDSLGFTIFLPLLLALIGGPFLLGVGLWRARLTPPWVPALWLVGAIAFEAVEGDKLAEAATFGPMMLALATLGLSLVRRQPQTRSQAAPPTAPTSHASSSP